MGATVHHLESHGEVFRSSDFECRDIEAERSGWVCGGWTVQVAGPEVTVTGGGDPVDGLRALCVAWWARATDLKDTDPGPVLTAVGW